ncbi:hypothetical protein C0389_07665 [bacterium]|nr:hypothetical protein [bacterium]
MKYFFLVFLFIISACSSSKSELTNLDTAKRLVQNYYESGELDRESEKIIDDAIRTIDEMKLTNKSAVVFDIDETALSNYKITKEIGFGFIPKLWDEWQLKGIAEALPQTKHFYDYLISKKIHVIFLTGRAAFTLESTRRNLIEKGFVKFDTLIVRDVDESKIPAGEFKSHKRDKLVKNGYEIIACIGDQDSDFTGGNTGYKIKLPNYIYFIN